MTNLSEFEAWIDVGGTFTDCFTRQAGKRIECKLLSSGRVPVSISRVSDESSLHCPELAGDTKLAGDTTGFWVGAKFRVYDSTSEMLAEYTVVSSTTGSIELSSPVATERWCQHPSQYRFELDASLEAPVLAVRRALQIPLSQPLPRGRIRLGTTRGTNALLTRRGARVALAITHPFEDLLKIGDQTRPDLFALSIRKPESLAEQTIGIFERLDASGRVLQPLDVDAARSDVTAARLAGCESLAICLMHGYLNPEHEQALADIAAEVGFQHISCSHQVAPLIEIVARAQTTVVDAYLSPIIRSYLDTLIEQFGGRETVQLDVMTSAGGLTPYDQFAGKDSILSGPAGGAVALEGIRRALGAEQLFGLDMGGTSTDVCRVSNDHSLQYESEKAGVRLLTPTLPIETVAAGGGSVCWFDGVALRVGPHSAGASPGPACYGRGGPLTLTDLNVFLGRLPVTQFPFSIDTDAITQRLDELLRQVSAELPIQSTIQLAEGFRRLANEQMAGAVSTVSLAQGVDPRGATLVGFGGAAGQHICEIAQLLDIREIVDVPPAGLLSALGMGLADLRADAAVPVYRQLPDCDWHTLDAQANATTSALVAAMLQRGLSQQQLVNQVWCELRYAGTDNTLSIARDATDLRTTFHAEHEKRFGYRRSEREIELVSLRIECIGLSSEQLPPAESVVSVIGVDLADSKNLAANEDSEHSPYKAIPRRDIIPGSRITGPAVILNTGSTLTIDRGWSGECLSDGSLRMRFAETKPATPTPRSDAHVTDFDPITRDCLSKRFSSIARQMGLVLQQTAVSVNVKQRRDFSCAIFDGQGRLLANAPHVPVHLGAMGTTVRYMLQHFPDMQPGDCFVTNDPFCGGSHLPDITVITPVFAADIKGPTMFVANRAHHADIGGVAPGSMSILARTLDEEGVVIPPMRLVAGGRDCSDDLLKLFQQAPFPPRNSHENLADLAAQQAANQRGVSLLTELASTYSWETLATYAGHILRASAKRIENYLLSNPPCDAAFTDYLDDGTPLSVRISSGQTSTKKSTNPRSGTRAEFRHSTNKSTDSGSGTHAEFRNSTIKSADGRDRPWLKLDFHGSGPISTSNFNANPSIVTAAVLYVLRCLVADDMPLNEGVLECVQLEIPPGILNPLPMLTSDQRGAATLPAVAAGNVETSQRIVDILLGAFGVAAASQGTMNNLLFGNERFGFYETICGGAGATLDAPGASAVHTHMTNTRLTDPEILEQRYPVRLQRFAIRQGSGGAGLHRGGDGVIRELEFLEPVQLSLLTSRRGPYAPFGINQGRAGALGCNTLFKPDGTSEELAGCCHLLVQPSDRVRIETPGGGGWGVSRTEAPA